MAGDTTRRTAVFGITAIGGLTAASGMAAAAVPTPRATEGPFYPTPSMRPMDIDNDLVKIRSLVEAAKGEVITLRGVLHDRNGAPLPTHRVEIWQCDADGNYMHNRDRRSAEHDKGFQGFGHDITDAEGRFTFRTIKPTVYPGRTPHIHAKVLRDGREVLTTQFYIAGHTDNARDGLFRRMTREQADAVSMVFREQDGEVITDLTVVI